MAVQLVRDLFKSAPKVFKQLPKALNAELSKRLFTPSETNASLKGRVQSEKGTFVGYGFGAVGTYVSKTDSKN